MENATKALLISAGVLLGIIIISLAVYVFANSAAFGESYESSQEEIRIANYNNKFEIYNKEEIRIYDIISVLNLSKEYKEKYGDTINVYMGTTLLTQSIDINEQIQINKDEIYRCSRITYNDEGKVNSITFVKHTQST